MKQNEAIKAFEQTCNEIVEAFIRKQKIPNEWWWVGDEIGGVACFGDHYPIAFSNIFYDLKCKRKKGLIFKWYEDSISLWETNKEDEIATYPEYCLIQDFTNGKFKEGVSFRSSDIEEIRKHLME